MSSNYTIRSGDTLSKLAQKFGTSVGSLMKANPQIKNADLIYAGAKLNLPGSKDEFVHSTGARSSQGTSGAQGAASQGPTGSPFEIAKAHLGQNASSMKLANDALGKAMHDGIPNNINCANFVSGCLEASGQIKKGEHNDSVLGLQSNLNKDPNFKRVSLSQAKPGDVVCFETPGGGHHVVMFAGMKNGKPTFIGSNNANADGTQRVTISPMNYKILSIHQYQG